MTSYVRQCAFFDYGNPGEQAWISTTLPLATLAGSTLLIFGAVSCYAGTRPQAAINSTQNNGHPTGDAVNGQYIQLQNIEDTNTGSDLAVALYIQQNAAAVPGGTVFTQNYTAGDDYIAMAVVEVAGVAANSLITSAQTVQTLASSGTNDLTTGTAPLGSNPVITLCLSVGTINGTLPNPGTGTTSQNTGYGWGSANSARIVSQNFSNPGTAGIAQSAPAADDYTTISIALLDATPTLFRMYANGAIQAHQFVQGGLPPGIAMRMYANNTLQSGTLVTGATNPRLFANGQLSVSSTIIV